MYRKVAGIVIGAAAIHGSYVAALGLGEMTMRSALHQPLDAQIRLTNVGDLDSDQIKIRLADQKAFDMAGVDRTYFLSNMRFNVIRDDSGDAVIQVTTKKSVKEPFLDFLIEVRWPTGKVVRSYTALVDLPVYQSASKPVVKRHRAPQTTTVTNQTYSQSNQIETFSYNQSKVSSDNKAPESPKGTYRIKNNDTLWEIAKKVRPSSDLSISKTMLAIQRNNPKAFPGNNINRIKSGSVLRLPTAAEINSVSRQQTAAIISVQNKQWQGAQLSATEAVLTQAPPKQTADGHLSLSSSGSGQANGTEEKGSGQSAAQPNDDALAVTQLKNDDLNNKVKVMSEQIAELERLIELKDAEMATMQSHLAQQNAAVVPVEEEKVVPPVETELAVTEGVAELIEPIATEQEKTSESVTETPEKASPLAFIKNFNPLHLGILGLFIMSIVAAFSIQRRNKKEKEALADAINFEYDDLDKPLDSEQSEASQPENTTEETIAVEEVIAPVDEIEDAQDVETDEPLVLETDDALGEADIYVAYGRYDQAVALLQSAIVNNDDTLPLRNKLLSIYLETADKNSFRQEYAESLTLGYAPVTSYAKDLLSSSDHTDWLDDIEANIDEESVLLDGDFSFEQELEASVASNESVDDAPLDFDESLLTSSHLEEGTSEVHGNTSTAELPEIDIDLSDIDQTESEVEPELLDLAGDLEETTEDESIDIDLADFGLSFGEESAAEDTTGDEVKSEDNFVADLEFFDVDDEADEIAIDLSDEALVDTNALKTEPNDNESLDESIEALAKLSETALDESEETAFTEAEDGVESFDFDDDPDLSFISSSDEVATKLDLARAYIDMGDIDGAKDMLKEVIEDGEQPQKEEANQLLESCS